MDPDPGLHQAPDRSGSRGLKSNQEKTYNFNYTENKKYFNFFSKAADVLSVYVEAQFRAQQGIIQGQQQNLPAQNQNQGPNQPQTPKQQKQPMQNPKSILEHQGQCQTR